MIFKHEKRAGQMAQSVKTFDVTPDNLSLIHKTHITVENKLPPSCPLTFTCKLLTCEFTHINMLLKKEKQNMKNKMYSEEQSLI